MGLAGKVAVVTGAAGTLGRAVATAFAAEGANLVLLDIAGEALTAVYGAESETRLPLPVDLADSAALVSAVAAATAKFGRIDCLANIAGGFAMGPAVHETADDLWWGQMRLNAGSVLNAARAFVPLLLAGGGGKIVNVGAMGGTVGRGNMGAYSASKSVVIRMTESMSAELRDRGINVNCVLPSIIDTKANRADMPDADHTRWVSPESLADVIVFLSSDAARAIHGAAIPVVGLS